MLPKIAAGDIAFRDGTAVEVVSTTGDGARDAIIRSNLKGMFTSKGYELGRGGWRLLVTGRAVDGTGYLTMNLGGKVQIPRIDGRVQLVDPAGAVAWETPARGGFDPNHSKYKTSKEESFGPGGVSITHFNFGFRGPKAAMTEEAWDNFVAGLGMVSRFPRVLARLNRKLVPLPIPVSVKAK